MIAAVVLAAGLSRRMGAPKLALSWGQTSVIGQVVAVLQQAGVPEICVVTGSAHDQVEAALAGMPVRLVFNPRYEEDAMLLSLQVGLQALPQGCTAAFVVLGDQPQMEPQVVSALMELYRAKQERLIVPSFRPPGLQSPRRGHPWLVGRALWPALLALQPPQTLRDFLNAHAAQITYLAVQTDSILRDLDTPADYASQRPLQD
jgi:molybdenum cofactor cytidylyltransferase